MSKKVLIVDDDADILEIVSMLLVDNGYAVENYQPEKLYLTIFKNFNQI